MSSLFSYKMTQQMKTGLPHAIPDGPLLKMGTNFFEFDRKKYLRVIDYFSKYPFISEVTSIAEETTIKNSKIEGSPETLITYNAPHSTLLISHSSANNGTESTLQVPQTIHNHMDTLREQSRQLNRKWLDVDTMARSGKR